MKQAVHDVELFMKGAGEETPSCPMMTETAKLYFGNPDDLSITSDGTVLIGGVVGEEIGKLADAWMRSDDLRVLDSALGTIWTIITGLRALGFPIAEAWQEIARSNHSTIDWAIGMCSRREDNEPGKPEEWTPPNLRAVLDMHGLLARARAELEARQRAHENDHTLNPVHHDNPVRTDDAVVELMR